MIFNDDSGGYIAKVADFGYSTQSVRDDELIIMPASWPWTAPEYHHRGFTHSQAAKMDVYSFSMLCLWLLFRENFSETSLILSDILNGKRGSIISTQQCNEYDRWNILDELKSQGKLVASAHQIVMTTTAFNDEQKSALDLFFSSTLVTDPVVRIPDFKQLLRFLDPNR